MPSEQGVPGARDQRLRVAPGDANLWKSQNTLWKEMFIHVAGLGDVPCVMAGDWNATPDQLFMPALAPRTSGWLFDVGGRRPTSFPAKGGPTEKYVFLVSHCLLRGAVADYEFLPVGALPTHGIGQLDSPSGWRRLGSRSGSSGSPGLSHTWSLVTRSPRPRTGPRGRSLRRRPQGSKQLGMPGPRRRRTGSWNGLVYPRGRKGFTGAEELRPSLGCACPFP